MQHQEPAFQCSTRSAMDILDKLNVTPPVAMTAAEIKALELLLSAARNDTRQSRRVADFLLAW